MKKSFNPQTARRSLARTVSLFVISTAVEKVALNFGKPDQKWIDQMTLAEAKQYLSDGTHFAKGSMAPKIQAIVDDYVRRTYASRAAPASAD